MIVHLLSFFSPVVVVDVLDLRKEESWTNEMYSMI